MPDLIKKRKSEPKRTVSRLCGIGGSVISRAVTVGLRRDGARLSRLSEKDEIFHSHHTSGSPDVFLSRPGFNPVVSLPTNAHLDVICETQPRVFGAPW